MTRARLANVMSRHPIPRNEPRDCRGTDGPGRLAFFDSSLFPRDSVWTSPVQDSSDRLVFFFTAPEVWEDQSGDGRPRSEAHMLCRTDLTNRAVPAT